MLGIVFLELVEMIKIILVKNNVFFLGWVDFLLICYDIF